ncbi:ATP-binding cassette domain-containing protein [Anoxynatronum buryatiense]|uniref:ABC-type lipoprotein export system, ATPase component n=1 Tax=Anoxynatronum buryatiense TaxID=489973 RepID=A0AA45WYY4_9CLOT|nr:ATP-binding cassette domain-containing protein [Anoxynatronum buryatiense]SMP71122.1 ABC-type lipoprotein export system, ATPase component [Anoxynatronum buryatiense]
MPAAKKNPQSDQASTQTTAGHSLSLQTIFADDTHTTGFFEAAGLPHPTKGITLQHYLHQLEEELLEDLGIDREDLVNQLACYLDHMKTLQAGNQLQVSSVTIAGGQNKHGQPEAVTVTIHQGEIVCIVGPTGSGKSRLLADIEWMAQGDTPTKRHIFINGQVPDKSWRFSLEHKLVAQLSQNMNFIMDLSVSEFIEMHAESRMIPKPEVAAKVKEITEQANALAGEMFYWDTPVTALSGGQSRALMIADTAFLSTSPIVLIDEIENAGIDRKKALDLLVSREKIILMSTHDPVLALMGSKRLVLRHGAIQKVVTTTVQEQQNIAPLQQLDELMLSYRHRLRSGETIDEIDLSQLMGR